MFISFCYFALQVFINFAKNQSDILPSEEEDSSTNVSAPGTWGNVLEFDFYKTEQINMSFLCHLHGMLLVLILSSFLQCLYLFSLKRIK